MRLSIAEYLPRERSPERRAVGKGISLPASIILPRCRAKTISQQTLYLVSREPNRYEIYILKIEFPS